MYEAGSGAAALGLVLAAPLAGIVGALVIVWRILRSAPGSRHGQVVTMYGGYEGRAEDGEWALRLDEQYLCLDRVGGEARRVAIDAIERAELDGEYLALRVRGDEATLLLRPFGATYPDRDLRLAAVEGLVAALRRR